MLILLDSSMLMIPLEKKINLSYELERILPISFEIVVPSVVLRELEELKERAEQSRKRKAHLALSLAASFRIIDSLEEEEADKELIRLAKEHNAIIATNDRELRLKLREEGVVVISLHGENRLTVFGDIEY